MPSMALSDIEGQFSRLKPIYA